MTFYPNEFRQRINNPVAQKAIRYTLGSGISFVISQVVFIASYGVFHLFDSRGSSIFATLAGAVPSYFMNRYWAWQKKSRSHFSKEVIPYFVMALVSLIFSTWATDFASSHRTIVGLSHLRQVAFVDGAYILSFAILWCAKYIFMDKVLFTKEASKAQKISA